MQRGEKKGIHRERDPRDLEKGEIRGFEQKRKKKFLRPKEGRQLKKLIWALKLRKRAAVKSEG